MQKNATNRKRIGGLLLLFLFFSFTVGTSIFLAGNGTDLRREKYACESDSTNKVNDISKQESEDEEPSHSGFPIAFPSTGTLAEVLSSFFRTFRPTASGLKPFVLNVDKFTIKLISCFCIRI